MPSRSKDPAALIPLKHSTYRVLLALADGELHGYAVMQKLSEMTDGRETILPGTLYAALARMVDDDLIETWEGPADDASGGPKRRYYRRTRFGRAVARAESERLGALLDIAQAQKIFSGEAK
jgi:DNA-binding PadR family transcriptional regulator